MSSNTIWSEGGGGGFYYNPHSSVIVTKDMLDARLKTIEERLLILVPDPNILEQYTSLKDAYNHYLLMEKLATSGKKK